MEKRLLILLLLIFNTSFSSPTLENPLPINGTYIFGSNEDVFSIVVNTPETPLAYLYIRVQDPTSKWEKINMNCYSLTKWICNTTVTGLKALVSDGQTLLYYFEVSDSTGTSYEGAQENPLMVFVDRSEPEVDLREIVNGSHISNNKYLKIYLKDKYSGIDRERVYFKYENNTFNSSWINSLVDNNTAIINFDTKIFQNGAPLKIYFKVYDKVGNFKELLLGTFFVDNEIPIIISTYPYNNQVIFGMVRISVYASDEYSGVKSAEYFIGSNIFGMSCLENNCTSIFDTRSFADGNYTVIFLVRDDANNSQIKSVKISIDNTNPQILLPQIPSYVSGKFLLNVSVGNVRNIKEAGLVINNTVYLMNCINFYCYYELDTRNFSDGRYFINVYAISESDIRSEIMFEIIFDNTKPSIEIENISYFNNKFSSKFLVSDNIGVDKNSIELLFENEKVKIYCVNISGNILFSCEANLEISLKSGNYIVEYKAEDFAKNLNKERRFLIINYTLPEEVLQEQTSNKGKGYEKESGGKSEIGEKIFVEKLISVGKTFNYKLILLILVVSLSIIFSLLFISKRLGKPVETIESLKKKDLENLEFALRYLKLKSKDIKEEKENLSNAKVFLLSLSMEDEKIVELIRRAEMENSLEKINEIKKLLIEKIENLKKEIEK